MPQLVMVLDDGATFSSLAGCRIVELPDGISPDLVDDVVCAAATNNLREAEELLAADGVDGTPATHYVFGGDPPALTGTETALLREGLCYLEANGAPSLGWRGNTKKMEAACESIHRKLWPRPQKQQ